MQYSFLEEGGISRLGNTAKDGVLSKLRRLINGLPSDKKDVMAGQLKALKKNDPEFASKFFQYFNGDKQHYFIRRGQEKVQAQFTPKQIADIEETAQRMLSGNMNDAASRTLELSKQDIAKTIGHGAGLGARRGKQIGQVTGVMAPTAALTTALKLQALTGNAVDVNAVKQATLGLGEQLGNTVNNDIIPWATRNLSKIPGIGQTVANNPWLTSLGAGAGSRFGIGGLGFLGRVDSQLGRIAGDKIGRATGGTIGTLTSLRHPVKNAKKAIMDIRPKSRLKQDGPSLREIYKKASDEWEFPQEGQGNASLIGKAWNKFWNASPIDK